MHFLFTFIQQTSLLLCHSGYLLLMLFSSDVFLFPEGTFRLKFSLNHYSYYLLVVMASTICKSSWWIAISPGSSRSNEWLQICIPWLFCPSHSWFQLAFLPMHSLLGAWAEKGSTKKGLGKKSQWIVRGTINSCWWPCMVKKEFHSTSYLRNKNNRLKPQLV